MICLGACVIGISSWASADSIAFGDALVRPLEQRFQRASIEDTTGLTGVIALGGHSERLREACRLAERHAHLKVFISGAGTDAQIRKELGPAWQHCKLQLENLSYNTHSNAVFTKATLKPTKGERWLLVTSASHMPRAVGVFRKAGMPVEPWPIYDLAGQSPLPVSAGSYEWFGLLSYWLRGHSNELFPAPIEMPPALTSEAKAAPVT